MVFITLLVFLVGSAYISKTDITPDYDGEHTADMYASGFEAQCVDTFLSQELSEEEFDIESEKCEKIYWKVYCHGDVGTPDENKCKGK